MGSSLYLAFLCYVFLISVPSQYFSEDLSKLNRLTNLRFFEDRNRSVWASEQWQSWEHCKLMFGSSSSTFQKNNILHRLIDNQCLLLIQAATGERPYMSTEVPTKCFGHCSLPRKDIEDVEILGRQTGYSIKFHWSGDLGFNV